MASRKQHPDAQALSCAILAFAAAISLCASAAEPPSAAFAAPFTPHAVLQRDCPLPVWGVAAPGAKVEVALDGQTAATVAGGDGAWRTGTHGLPVHGTVTAVYEVFGSEVTGTPIAFAVTFNPKAFMMVVR